MIAKPNFLFLLVFPLAAFAQSAGLDPNRPFDDLRSCQYLAKLTKVKETSYDLTNAKSAIEETSRSIDKFPTACAAYLKDMQNPEAIEKFNRTATFTSTLKQMAEQRYTEALDELRKIEGPLKELGADKGCVTSVAEERSKLKSQMDALNAKSSVISKCGK